MQSSKTFWHYIYAGVAGILIFTGVAVWNAYQAPTSVPVRAVAVPKTTAADGQSSTTIKQVPDEKLPAPAKKLQKLIADNEEQTAGAVLQQRIEKLNASISELNQALDREGLAAPSDEDLQISAADQQIDNEIHQRLLSIQEHITNKNTH